MPAAPASIRRRHPPGWRLFFVQKEFAMSFAVRNLSVLAYANGFTLWHYKAGQDVLGRVEQPGFFGGASDMLAGGDMLMVSALDGARMLSIVPRGEEHGELVTARMC
jgi:hypothetical protein